MKIIKSFFLFALMTVSFTLSASNNPDELHVKSKVVDNNAIVVQLINLQQAATSVTIESLDGETIYFKELVRHHNGYIRKINLDNLSEGRYVLQVNQGDVSKKQVVLVRDGKVQLSSVKG